MAGSRLSRGGIAVSVAHLDAIDWTACGMVLHPSELGYARSCRNGKSAAQFVAGRLLLRATLSWCATCPPFSFAFRVDHVGMPQLIDNPWSFYFSVSHSSDLAAVAVSAAPVGIDVERVSCDFDWFHIAVQLLHPREAEFLMDPSTPDPTAEFFRIWTRKEALLKATSAGISADLHACAALGDGPIDVPNSTIAWHLVDIPARHGYAAALATSHSQPDIVYLPVAQLW